MAYALGVDLGTIHTAAALLRGTAGPQVLALGEGSALVPTVLHIAADGSVLSGEQAARRRGTDPDRVVRGFKQRIGDQTPVVIGTGEDRVAHHAHDLAAAVVASVVATVTAREGAAPDSVAVTYPTAWFPRPVALFRAALAAHDLPHLTVVTEAEAAARAYALSADVRPGETLAVYDFGGGAFNATVLRVDDDGGFVVLGRPERRCDIGGAGLDDAVVSHVTGELDLGARGRLPAPGAEADRPALEAAAQLRVACLAAKEALSTRDEVTVPLPFADREALVLTRSTFEMLVLSPVASTVRTLSRCLSRAGVTGCDVSRVLLVGGSSRIPLVVQMVSAHLGPRVEVVRDLDPMTAVACGAVLAAGAAGRPASGPASAAGRTSTAPVVPRQQGPGRALIPRPGRTGGTAGAEPRPEVDPLAAEIAAHVQAEAAARAEVADADRALLAATAQAEAAEAVRLVAEAVARSATAEAAAGAADIAARVRVAEEAQARAEATARELATRAACAQAAALAHARAVAAVRAEAAAAGRAAEERVAAAEAEVARRAHLAVAAHDEVEAVTAARTGAANRAAAAAAARAVAELTLRAAAVQTPDEAEARSRRMGSN